MRHSDQLPLTAPWLGHEHTAELAAISELLDLEPRLAKRIQQDLERVCPMNPRTGRPGLTGDQVLRIAVARQLNGWTYAELAFHLADSQSYRTFCRLGPFDPAPSTSALAANLGRLRPETLITLNDRLVTSAAAQVVESGECVRIDSTVVPTAIHPPTDSSLLVDSIRVLLRLLRRAEQVAGFTAYHQHLKRAKRRLLAIMHAKPQAAAARRAAYQDLVALAQATADYATCALAHLGPRPGAASPRERARLHTKLTRVLPLVQQVIEQTRRRVVHGETVPATEKLVSLFEPHTDILVKDRRDTYYGHKVFLTGGRSGLFLDCAVVTGNPADALWTMPLLERHQQRFGTAPRQATFDGAFASQDNLADAKQLGVEDVCFTKGRGLTIEAMTRSRGIYRRLRRFRAGIESGISLLKRVFGLDRCRWKGESRFAAYIRLGVLAANLLLLARHRLS